ncbi:hypothetical protein [Aneurinibacillus thermoaerophilus]|uniref:Uncharacterized protein n=1 Tax=Aneurinibacillus thermoaerophilus TaxID=143495 RepID=A0A1G8CR17_ANETH|nr:hypothetical protein [Aneurinibacillus thermoaerophilus]MED0677200.1 hypothetical protein [Aneurinibacillus thermoaerophilus]MED0680492.1 hypothetical protein [Aneurinibacillus thermoaerophilus]MED0737248.1 hypothetical protein [Aneurinibacillus thermoaerophilus]MED0757937.1 hypothetical protein [Aneurinibacillus thermoaerophilus]MED0761635.1 hypothetical protein [Aneurinibacillus thermoaerophilus]
MWALMELIGFAGLILFGTLAIVSVMRNRDPKNYMKLASIFFVILIIAIILDRQLETPLQTLLL